MNLTAIFTPELITLRAAFVARGFDIRLVGGAVRDLLRGVEPKDLDFCTDANPDEQMEIYTAAGFAFHETGLQHGTLTVIVGGEPYEITSLRTETDHDGRHAVVSYTRDWMGDLARRDLTFNAMALTFDGTLIDPFDGAGDLAKNIVRFVGNADDRMEEDYLRILRWLRFHGRIASGQSLDAETAIAANRQAPGLAKISRERVWMEVSKIVVGNGAVGLIDSMFDLGIAGFIGLPMVQPFKDVSVYTLDDARMGGTTNPVTAMVAVLGRDLDAVTKIAADWKWSAAERDFGIWLCKASVGFTGNYMKFMAHDGVSREWVSELARLNGGRTVAAQILEADVPVFPVTGQDLVDAGMKPGKDVGVRMRFMRDAWTQSRWTMDKDALMSCSGWQ